MKNQTDTKKWGLDLTEGPIFKSLAVFTIPIIVSGLIQQLYSVVDLIIIGMFLGNAGTVGVSAGGEVSDLVTPVALAFSSAGQIYIAQITGGKMEERIRSAAGTLLSVMLILACGFMLISLVFHKPILTLLNCPEDAMGQAAAYMWITALGIPFIFGYNAVCGILRGMGESKSPMYFIVIAAVVNILLDVPFVAVFHWGAAGTAAATVIAQLLSFLAAVFFLYRHEDQLGLELDVSAFRINRRDLKVLLALGIPQAVRSSLVRVSMFWVNRNVNAYGVVVSAANSIGNKLLKFTDIFSGALQQAAAVIIGQNLGAGKQERVKKFVWCTFTSAFGIAALISAVFILLPKPIFGIFTGDREVLELGAVYLRIMAAHVLWSAAIAAFQAVVVGSGFASLNFMIGILDGVLCKVGLSVLFVYGMGLGAVGFFAGTAWSRALPTVICFLYFCGGRWAQRKLL
ncbi:MATE family efflux transporter [Diplocloster hominis]|uniref:MATE family efflux transporter n=1 Tax=Diplocloster hominis TaxID=3079010 RepID=UPI0031BB3C9F